MRIMVTNGGPHPPEAWAVVTAEQLFPLDNDIAADRRVAALQLQAKVAAALVRHHAAVAEKEMAALASDARFGEPHHADDADVEAAIDSVHDAAQGTPWADHVRKPDVEAAMRVMLHKHFATVQHVHRLHHASEHPNNEAGQNYRAAFHRMEE